jgi:hypothetical protein
VGKLVPLPAGQKKSVKVLRRGLPDFSWYNKPKWERIQIPNDPKIDQIATKYPNGHKTFPLSRLTKIYQNWNFSL